MMQQKLNQRMPNLLKSLKDQFYRLGKTTPQSCGAKQGNGHKLVWLDAQYNPGNMHMFRTSMDV